MNFNTPSIHSAGLRILAVAVLSFFQLGFSSHLSFGNGSNGDAEAPCTNFQVFEQQTSAHTNISQVICMTFSGEGASADCEGYEIDLQAPGSLICKSLNCTSCVCFPGKSQVQLESGEMVSMGDLDIGDRILSGYNEGSPVYSPVVDIPHRVPRTVASFMQVFYRELGSVYQLKISADHLIYLADSTDQVFDSEIARTGFAKDLKEGDLIWSQDQVVRVREVNQIELKQGIYAPHTESGTLVVFDEEDTEGKAGALTSCYSHVADPATAHKYFSWRRSLWPPASLKDQPIRNSGMIEEWALQGAKFLYPQGFFKGEHRK